MRSFHTGAPMVIRYDDRSFDLAVKALQRMSPHHRGTLVLFTGMTASEREQAARTLATNLELDLNSVDLSSIQSKYIGETEKNLHDLFESASAANAILFFDEADALFGKRSEVKDAHDRYANPGVSYSLGLLEGYRGIILLTVKSSTPLVRARNRRGMIIFCGNCE